MIWPDHDLLKFGLGSGKNKRDASAIEALNKYLSHERATAQPLKEWRAELPCMEGAPWGDCQRLEMVFGTALKLKLQSAKAASAVGLEWLWCPNLETVDWPVVLANASRDAMSFSGLEGEDGLRWEEYTPVRTTHPAGGSSRIHGPSQLDAWRTMRNNRGGCALKGCGAPLPRHPLTDPEMRWSYCSTAHADQDAALWHAATTAVDANQEGCTAPAPNGETPSTPASMPCFCPPSARKPCAPDDRVRDVKGRQLCCPYDDPGMAAFYGVPASEVRTSGRRAAMSKRRKGTLEEIAQRAADARTSG